MELTIQLFGNVGLFRADRRLPDFPTLKSKALFCFLVLNRGRLYSRDTLMGVLWGEKRADVARKNLRTDIWRVRRILEPKGVARGTYLIASKDALGFNSRTAYQLDVEEFERKIGPSEGRSAAEMTEADSVALCQAVELYRGDLLEELYDDWCVVEQERLKAKFIATLEKLMRYHAQRREWGTALVFGRRVLRYDPLREHIHRDVMRYHYHQGNRPAALAQFKECERLLRREMRIEPMRETLRLREAIEAERIDLDPSLGAKGSAPKALVPDPATDVDTALNEIRAAVEEVQAAMARLQTVLQKSYSPNDLRDRR